MTTLRVALAQICSGPDPAANLTSLSLSVRKAAAAGARLVVLPEAAMCWFSSPLAPVAEQLDGRWAQALSRVAAAENVTVVAGMFRPSEDGRVYNTLVATDGRNLTGYDKIHLFDALGFAESRTVAPGQELAIIEVDGARIGLSTCFDVRFPWLYQELARRGAQAVVVAASWGDGPGKLDQWRLLTSARALDSTSYVLACDQADPKAAFGPDHGGSPKAPLGVGHSRVVSPFGETLAEAGAGPELLLVDLDLDVVDRARVALPVLSADAGRVGGR